MIKKLQKNFIRIAALALLFVLLLVTASINGAFLYQSNQILNHRLNGLLHSQDKKPKNNASTSAGQNSQSDDADSPTHKHDKQPPEQESAFELFPQLHNKMLQNTSGYVITTDTSYQLLDVAYCSEEDEADTDAIGTFLASVKASGKSHGWYQTNKYQILHDTDEDGSEILRIAVLDASPSLYSILSVLLISLIVGTVLFLILLLLIVAASRRAIQPLIESYQKQNQFITDAGHELKTPLTVISANSELARMTYGDSEWFDGIDRQVQRMNKLVRELITLAKMDEQQKLDFEPFNLSDALYDVMLPFEQVLTRQEKKLIYDITDDITLKGNESSIRELISILIDNAAKYCTEQGTVHVTLHTVNNKIHLGITNDFPDAENCDFSAIFDRFYRADKSRKSDGSYGLGLSIAKNIVEMHHGTITAKAAGATKVVFEVVFRN